jgi:hypothetical protein
MGNIPETQIPLAQHLRQRNSGKVAKPTTNPANGYLLWTMAHIDAIRIQLREETGQ